ncbi:TPA: hypothetical protein ACLBZ1_003780 [Bacillus cereus]
MNKNIDVMSLAQEIERKNKEFNLNEIAEFIDQFNGKTMDSNEILQKIVAPLIGMRSSQERLFTIELIQKVVDEINSEKELV